MSISTAIPEITCPPAAPCGVVQRKCGCGGTASASGECEECKKKKLQRSSRGCSAMDGQDVPPVVHEVLSTPGDQLNEGIVTSLSAKMGHDFSDVRVHTDARAGDSAAAVHAEAYTVGRHLVFGHGRFRPESEDGRRLIAHELAHVIQQSGPASTPSGPISIESAAHPNESAAERTAQAAGNSSAGMTATSHALQRKVEMRDVGKAEYSGFARIPELITRLNAVSKALTFEMSGNELIYKLKDKATPSEFDTQMMAFIDSGDVLPLRLTNRSSLMRNNAASPYNMPVEGDSYVTGYVDMDDLLAGTDLGMQMLLVHFLAERVATKGYARRIGTAFTRAEFNKAHDIGIDAEIKVLRDYFSDPTIRLASKGFGTTVVRSYRNAAGVIFFWRQRNLTGASRGIHMDYIQVRTRDGRTHTAEEYLKLITPVAAPAATPATP